MNSAGAPVQAVIFDLDGTLVQTRVASWEVFRQVDAKFHLGVDTPEKYFDLFRGNVFKSLETLCRDAAHAAEVKEHFLQLLRSDYTPPMVPGMSDTVRRLAGHCTLAVMSSNAMSVLRRVLVGNDLAFCFGHVFGGDVAPDKRTAIATLLADAGSGFGRRCSADYDEAGPQTRLEPGGTVLVTDTAGDVADALAAGIRVVGVAWGMHTVAELTEAGAEFVALWPQEVAAHLLGQDGTAPSGSCSTGSCSTGGRHAAAIDEGSLEEQVARAGSRRRARRRGGDDVVLPAGGSVPVAPALAAGAQAPSTRGEDEVLDAVRRTCAPPRSGVGARSR